MFKKLFIFASFFGYSHSATAMQLETVDNFTRFIFEAKDFQVTVGSVSENTWNISALESLKAANSNCSLKTTPIFAPIDFKIFGHIKMKAYTSVFLESISKINTIPVFKIKLLSLTEDNNLISELQSATIGLSDLKETEINVQKGDSYYISAKTNGDGFLNIPITFNHNQIHPAGFLQICLSDVLGRTDLNIENISLDVYM